MKRWFVILMVLAATPVHAGMWLMQDGSTFTFTANFEGELLEGRFTRFDVLLDAASQEKAPGSLQVNVKLAGADMGDPDLNEAIAAAEWFDVAGFPEALFESNDIVELAPGSFVAHGELLLKDKRRDVDVPFAWAESGDAATMRGEVILKRLDYDIGTGEWAIGEQIGNDVILRFDLQFERAD